MDPVPLPEEGLAVFLGDGAGLEPTHTATHVRIREGKRVVQDGPFAETREQLGGYYTLDASSEEEALEWASKIPDAAVGTIEVRPVRNAVTAPTPPDKDGKKEYLLVIYEPEARWASLGEEEAKAIFARYNDFSTSLKQSGRFVAGGQLDGTKKARSVSTKAGERVVRDGPFAETREQLGGYYRILARDLDERRHARVQGAAQHDHLPEVLGACPALDIVGFKANRIAHVPGHALPPSLRWLILTDNALGALPVALGERPSLQKLMLAGNRLQTLPDSLAQADKLFRRDGITALNTTHTSIEEIASKILAGLGIEKHMF